MRSAAFELGCGNGEIGDLSVGMTLGGSVGATFGFGGEPPPPPATTPADTIDLNAAMPAGVTADYDSSTGQVTLHVPPDMIIVRPLADIPPAWRLQLGLPVAGIKAIAKLVAPPPTTNRLGIARSKIESGQVTAMSRAAAQLVDLPLAPVKKPFALFSDQTSTAKKAAIVATGVGALGTITYLAWQAMR